MLSFRPLCRVRMLALGCALLCGTLLAGAEVCRRAGGCEAHRRSRGQSRRLAHARPHLRRAALQPAGGDRPGQREGPEARVVFRSRHQARPGSDAAGRRRHDVCHVGMEQSVRARRAHRQREVALRSASRRRQGDRCLLRRRESRRRGLGSQRLRRHARRPADRSRHARAASRCGRCRRPTRRSVTRSPARRASSRARSSSATAAARWACAVTCPRTTRSPARCSGVSTQCPAIRRTASRTR